MLNILLAYVLKAQLYLAESLAELPCFILLVLCRILVSFVMFDCLLI